MAKVVVFPPKDPAETKLYSFDFSADLECGETILMATASVNYVNGTGDANNLSTYLSGSPVWDDCSAVVHQAFTLGNCFSTYDLRVLATTSKMQVLVRVGRITVVSQM